MSESLNKTIVLIDDDQSLLSLLAKLLEIERYRVIPLRSPDTQTLLETLDANKPQAMIIDVHLEGQNGLDLLRTIRDHRISHPLKVMMTSGEDLRDQCLRAGADGFLLKPYMPTDLVNWLQVQFQSLDIKEG